ncbi:MAG: c-type cytochrome biogenesis protein CcmI [Alphaproteobacteria bacterium]
MTDAVLFWTVAVIVTGFVLLALVPPLLGRGGRTEDRDETARALYRGQLKQVESDLARRRISAADAELARAEIGRRLLHASTGRAAAPVAVEPPRRSRRGWAWATGVVVAAPLAAAGLYITVGKPDLPDQPLAERKDVADAAQARASAEALVSEMTVAVERDASDLRSWVLLARAQASLDRLDEAAAAYANAIALAPGQADLSAAYGEVLVLQANGQVTDRAAEAFDAALDQVPDDPRARYYLALRRFQQGDLRLALAEWRALAADSEPDAGWMDAVRARIAETETSLGPEAMQTAEARLATRSAAPMRTDDADAAMAPSEPEQSFAESPAPAPAPGSAGPMPNVAVPVEAPAAAPQPAAPVLSEPQIAAMLDLPPDEQAARIAEMVGRLAVRLEQSPEDVDGWMILARSYVALGDLPAARNALANASEHGPDRIDAQIAYARMILEGQPLDSPVPTEAIAAFDRVIAADPSHPDALWFLGLAAAQQRDFATARTRWTQLLDTLDPQSEAYVDVQSYIAALAGGQPPAADDAGAAGAPPLDSSNRADPDLAQ